MTESEFETFTRLNPDRDAAECGPSDLTFKQARKICADYLKFQQHLNREYELDESESITISGVTGEIFYGLD